MTSAPRKILVIGPSWVGDMVMSQVLYIHLRQSRPGCLIDVLAPAWSAPVLQRMPEVNRAIAMPLGHGQLGMTVRWRLGRELRREAYEQAIVLPNSLKSALVPFFAGVARRTGWRGEMRYGLLNDMRRLDKTALPLMAQRFLALGQDAADSLPAALPQPALRVDQSAARATASEFGLAADRPILALCPGSEFGGAKRWPARHYAEIASAYLARGWQVTLYGSASDREVCARIVDYSGRHRYCRNLAGRTSLAQVVDLLSLSTAMVTNDSGLMHIGAALARPLLALYGATSPEFTPPMSPAADLLVSDLDCAPCFQRECPLGHHRCMRDITPAQATARLAALLDGLA